LHRLYPHAESLHESEHSSTTHSEDRNTSAKSKMDVIIIIDDPEDSRGAFRPIRGLRPRANTNGGSSSEPIWIDDDLDDDATSTSARPAQRTDVEEERQEDDAVKNEVAVEQNEATNVLAVEQNEATSAQAVEQNEATSAQAVEQNEVTNVLAVDQAEDSSVHGPEGNFRMISWIIFSA
jgi:hypothetical protein